MSRAGAGFAGFATWLDLSPADFDMFAIPDTDSLTQLPWKKEVGWLAADLHLNGAPLQQAPRNVLKRAIVAAAEQGFAMKSGVECEFFLIAPDGQSISDPADTQDKPCYDQQALMRRFDVIAEICDSLGELKWGVYQNDHEDANGQFEINWSFDDALKTADRHLFFKYMVKSIAEKHGARATFMPKPFSNLTGNGCHAHVSLWSTTAPETNLFADPAGELGLSPLACHFVGGLTLSGAAICALTNPTVNSYKRLNAPVTVSGATWSPNTITFSGNNRTHMIENSGRWPSRVPLGRRRGQSVPFAGRASRRWHGWHPQEARSGKAARRQHVYAGCRGRRRAAPSAQSARRNPLLREVRNPGRGLRRGVHHGLCEDQAWRVEPVRAASQPMGAPEHADFNAIDPFRIDLADGRAFLSDGSFWSEIKLRELDPRTGKLISLDTPIFELAARAGGGALEASAIDEHADEILPFRQLRPMLQGRRLDLQHLRWPCGPHRRALSRQGGRAFKDYAAYLAPGERATIMVIAADRRQARVIMRYVKALLEIPALAELLEGETAESVDLSYKAFQNSKIMIA